MRYFWLCLALCLALAGAWTPGPLLAQSADTAQQTTAPDFDAWERAANRAESLLESGRASTAFLENLREALTDWRSRLVAAETANQTRIDSITAQINALGPVPEGGVPEADTIAARRQTLSDQLARAQAPGLNASAAATRAEGLIREVDSILRERQQEEFLELDPTPLNPVNWPLALSAIAEVWSDLQDDLTTRLADPERREALVDDAPILGLMLLVGIMALVRGRHWTARLTTPLQRRSHERGRALGAFVVSLSQIAVPVVGVIAILAAIGGTGMFGEEALALLRSLGAFVAATFFGLWLAGRLFLEGDGPLGILEMDADHKAKARHATVLIGALYGVGVVIRTFSEFSQVSPAAGGVLTLPIYLLLGLAFWRFSRALDIGQPDSTPEDGSGFTRAILRALAKALLIVAVLGPVLALIGFNNAAEMIMMPTALTLGILSVIVALQPLIRDLYALIFRTTQSSASDALLPVLVNFLLLFVAVPLIALAWGMRVSQLREVYTRFWEGITIGGVQLTPGTVLAVILIFAVGLVITRLLQGALKTTVLPRTKLDAGARNAVNAGVGYIGIALAAVIAITAGGIDLTALGFVLGALSVGIGFGLQNVVSNFVSGIILLIERPISEGDWIEVNGNMGIVKDISVRSTRIETFDKTDVIVPNADFISGTVTNWTRGNNIGRAIVTVGVAYGSDTRRIQEILLEIARENPMVAKFPEPGVDFLGFGADSLDFRIRAILRDVNQLITVKTELNHRINERFAEEGIEIPFAQRDVWLRNPETLRDAASAADPQSGSQDESPKSA